MRKLSIIIKSIFSKEHHPLVFILISFCMAALFSGMLLIEDYPQKKSIHHYSSMDQDTFVIQKRVNEPIELFEDDTEVLKAAKTDFDNTMKLVGMDQRIDTCNIGYSFYVENTQYVYIPAEMNINSFGNIYKEKRFKNDVINIFTHYPEHGVSPSEDYIYHSVRRDDIDGKCMFTYDTVIFSNIDLLKQQKFPPMQIQYFYFSAHVKDGLSIEDSSYLHDSGTESGNGLERKYERYMDQFEDCFYATSYTLFSTLSESMLWISSFFTVVSACAIGLSNYLSMKNRKNELQALRALGFTDTKNITFTTCVSLFHSLIGYLAFTILYSIADSINVSIASFSFINPLSFIYTFIPVVTLTLASFISTLAYLIFKPKN